MNVNEILKWKPQEQTTSSGSGSSGNGMSVSEILSYKPAEDTRRNFSETNRPSRRETETQNAAIGTSRYMGGVYNRADRRTSTLSNSKYGEILNRSDYAEKSQAAGSKVGFGFGNDVLYDYINDIDGQRDKTDYAAVRGYGAQNMSMAKYAFMTNDEKGVYNYLYATEGRKAANKFLDTLDADLNAQWQSGAERNIAAEAGKNIASKAAYSALTAMAMPARSMTGVLATGQDIVRTVTGKDIDPNSSLRQINLNTQAAREGVSQDMGKVGQFLYNTGMSAADSAVNLITMRGVGQALGYTGDALMKLTNVLASGSLSSEVASLSIAESKKKGYSDVGAMSLGLIRGGIEYLSEKLGGEWVIKSVKKNPANFLNVLAHAMIPEGIEENMSDVGNELVNLASDAMFHTNESYLVATYNAYKKQGNKNPLLATAKDTVIHELLSFAGGALAAGPSATVQYSTNKSAIAASAKALDTTDDKISDLMEKYEIENPRVVELIANLTDSKNVKDFDEAMTAYENAQEVIDEAMRMSGQTTGSLLKEAGIGSVSNQVDSAWDVLTGKVSAEESQMRSRNAMKALGLSNSQVRAAEGSNAYVAPKSVVSQKELATVYGDAQKKLAAEGVTDERLAAAITAVALNEVSDQQDASGVSAPTKLQQKLVSENEMAQRLVAELVAESNRRASEKVISEEELRGAKYDGAGIEITGFNDGNVQIRTEDGTEQTVPISRLEVSGGYASLLDAASKMKNGSAMLKAYKAGQNVDSFINAWKTAETLIGENTDWSMEKAREEYPSIFGVLSDSQLIRAIEEGRQNRNENKKRAKEQGEKAKAIRAEAEKLEKEGKVKRKSGTVTFDGVNEKKLNKKQKLVANMVKAVADVLSFDFVLYEGEENTGGVYIQGGKIKININSGRYAGKYIGAATLAHEITHALQEYDKEAYAEFKDFITNDVLTSRELARLVNRQLALEPNLTPGEALDEAIANGCARMLLNNEAIQKLAEKNRGLFGWVVDKINEITGNINKAYEEIDLSDDIGVYEAARIFQRSENEIRERWNKMLVTANENRQAEQMTGKKISAGAKSKMMRMALDGDIQYDFGVKQSDINDFIDKAYVKENRAEYRKWAYAEDRLIEDVKDEVQDIAEYTHAIRDNDVRHVKISHGEETNEKYPVTKDDQKLIPYIVKNYDKVLVKSKDGKPGLVYVKVMDNNYVYYLESVTDEYNKEKLLINKQMIKTGIGDIPNMPGLEAAIKKKQALAEFLADLEEIHKAYARSAYQDSTVSNTSIADESAKSNTEIDAGDTAFEYDAETESVNEQHQLLTWEASDYVTERNKAAKEMAEKLGISQKKARDYIDSVNSVAKYIAENKGRLDYEDTGRSPFVGNVEYGGSFDFTTLCKKRRLLTGTFSAIQQALANTALTANEILEIRKMMDDAGLEVSCGKCYVEGSRASMGIFTKEFLKLYEKYNPGAWVPNMAQMNTPDGIEWVRVNHPEVYEQYEYFWNHYGTLRPGDPNLFASQQKPKLYQMRSAYKGEVLKHFKNDGSIQEKNKNGGLRMQSFSDFEIVHLLDAMQVIMDMSRVGLNGQAYTKVPDFAWALGRTGLKINLSIDAWDVVDGKLVFNNKEGMNFDEAMRIRDANSKNVGTICCVYDDAQLLAALADPRIDFIIPFHRSQWKKSQYKGMGLPATTKDYTYQQNEKWLNPSAHTHEYRGRQVKDKCTNYMPNEYWDFSKSGKENAEEYLRMCARDGKRPKFYKFLTNNGDGSYSLKADGSTDGYWKLLIDFKMYDNDGVGSPQMPVRPDFNMEEIMRMLQSYEGGHNSFPVARGVVDQFVNKYKAEHKGQQFQKLGNENLDALYDKYIEKGKEYQAARKQLSEMKGEEYDKRLDAVFKAPKEERSKALEEFNGWQTKTGIVAQEEKTKELQKEYDRLRQEYDAASLENEKAQIRKEIEKSGKTEADYYRDKAVKEFGYTPYYYDAGYIVPNGKMLNFSGEKGKHYGSRGQDHRAIGTIFTSDLSGTKAMLKFMEQGNVRLMEETPGIDINSKTEPTKEQYATIKSFASNSARKEYFIVDFTDEDGNTVGSIEYEDRVRPDRIVNDIKHFYETGEVRQQGLSQFYQKLGIGETAEEQQARKESLDNLKAENRILRARAEYWKAQTRPTKERTVRQQDTNRLANELLKKFDSKADREDVKASIKALGDWLVQTNDLDYDELKAKAQAIAEDIVSGNYVLLDNSQQENLDRLKDYLKSTPVNLTKADFNDTGDENFRKKYGRYFTISDRGRTIDSLWGEMAAMFGEGIFPEDTYAPGDMLNMIADYLDMWKPQYGNAFEMYHQEAVDSATNEIIDAILSEDVRQSPDTYADKAQKKLNAQIAKDRERLDALREAKNARIEELKRQASEKNAQIRLAEKAAKYEAVSKVKKHYQDMLKRQRNKRGDTALRAKIKKLHKELSDILIKPKVERYVPKELVKATAEILGAIDTTSGRAVKAKAALAELKVKYDALAKDTKYAITYDDTISGMIQNLAENVGDGSIYDLTGSNLEAVYNTLKALKHTIVTANKLIGAKIEADAFEAATQMMNETENAKGIPTKALRRFVMAQLTPSSAFRMFGGYVKNSMWEQMFNELNNGQLTQTQVLMEGGNIFRELIDDKKNMDKLHDQKHLLDIGLKDPQGNPILVTRGMMLSVYMHLLNEQNSRHVAYGGLTVPRLKQYYKNNMKDAYKGETGRAVAFATEIADLNEQLKNTDDVQEQEAIKDKIAELQEKTDAYMSNLRSTIEEQLTEYDRKWIAAAQEFFNVYSKGKLNEVTEMVYGFSKAQVDNYFPIHTDPDYRSASFDTIVRDMNLENAGFMKERVNGANPILLEDITDVISSQLRRTAQYVGLMPAIKNFNKVYGKARAGYSMSVQSAMSRKFEGEGQKYIENLMADLNGARKTEANIFDELRGNMAGAVLTLNPRVTLAQTASFPTAAAEIGYAPLMKALTDMKNPMWDKGLKEEITKWTPLYWYRSQGYSTTELGDIKQNEQTMKRIMDKFKFATNWIQTADLYTTGGLWQASKYYVDANFSSLEKGSDEYMMKVAEVYNRVIEKTQPDYTTMQRPDILRNPNAIVKQLTMFMTQRLQNMNILYDAAATYSHYMRDLEKGRNGVTAADVKQARTRLVWAVSSQVAASMTIVIFKAIADALMHNLKAYRDDDDELTAESVSKTMLENFVETVMGNALWGSEVYSWMKSAITGDRYYGISLNGVETFADTLSDANKTLQKVLKGDWAGAKAPFWQLAKAVAQFFGAPLGNAEKFYNMGVKYVQDAQNGTWYESDVDRTRAQNTHILFNAMQAGDTTKADRIRAEFKDKKDEQSALKGYIKELYTGKDQKIMKAETINLLQRYCGLTKREAEDIAQKWTCEVVTGIKFDDLQSEYISGNLPKAKAMKYYKDYSSNGRTTEAEAEAKVNEWTCEKETGIAYSDIGTEVKTGRLSQEKAVKMVMKYGGKDEDAATKTVNGYLIEHEYDIKPSELEEQYMAGDVSDEDALDILLRYRYYGKDEAEKKASEELERMRFVRENPDAEDISVTQVRNYNAAELNGVVSASVYAEAAKMMGTFHGYDNNGDGKTDSYSIIIQKLEYIDTLDLDPEQKTRLAQALGISDKNIRRRAPWR